MILYLSQPDRFPITIMISKWIQGCGSEAESEEVLKPRASFKKSKEHDK